jgi:acyl-CoA synthetase (AMP-forming)/AMP-acid ligase II
MMIDTLIETAAARRGEVPYLADATGGRTLTYAQLGRSVRAWAEHLDRAGIPPGSRVAIRLPDPLRYATALVSILGAGRVVVPLDPGAPTGEVARAIAASRPDYLVPEYPDPVETVSGADNTDSEYPRLEGGGGIFLCTSGTTGTPKGILLGVEQLCHVAACVVRSHRITADDRGYCCLPLFHVNAEVVGLLATLTAGACLVVDGRFSRRAFWELIERQRVTWINAVPAIISVLAMEPGAVRVPDRVRFVRSASAPLPPSALRGFEKAFGIPVIETYGMTEAASMITANPLDGPRKAGSVGLPVGSQVRVVRRAGDEPEPACEVGRVQIRGRGVIRSYAAGGAGAIDPDGWLDTGDLGYLDEDGYLFLVGRSDDVINRGGEKIYPREIEDFLLAQPDVRFAAVIAAHDEVLGERPVAYVVPAEDAQAGAPQLEEALREACEAALPRPKRPAAFHLVPELPLGPTGKVVRRRLAELSPTGSRSRWGRS